MTDEEAQNVLLLIQYFAAELASKGIRFLIVGEYNLGTKKEPTETEQALLRLRFDTNGIGDRITWLQSNPNHFKALYGDLKHYSDVYIHAIFHPVAPFATAKGRINQPYQSEYVNTVGGYRLTTEQPAIYDHSVFIVGNSSIYGFGCEDKHTLPSQLQTYFNQETEKLNKPSYSAFNLGVRGGSLYLNFLTLRNLQCQSGDIVVLQGINHKVIRQLQKDVLNNIHTLLIDFSVANKGQNKQQKTTQEVFFDAGHVNYKGQAIAAKQIFQVLKGINNQVESVNLLSESMMEQARARLEEIAAPYNQRKSFLEKHPDLKVFLDSLISFKAQSLHCGSVNVNCNPFTLGHQYLLEYAAARVDHLYIFVVEEDRSLFDFQTRYNMVVAGTKHLNNVTVLGSGKFMMSTLTCPEYFSKDQNSHVIIDASSDLRLFAEYIAPILNIQQRFIGSEPICNITRQHNQQMRSILPTYGIKVEEITRLDKNGEIISASKVRELLLEKKSNSTLLTLIPKSTLDMIKKQCNVKQSALEKALYHCKSYLQHKRKT